MMFPYPFLKKISSKLGIFLFPAASVFHLQQDKAQMGALGALEELQ